MASLAAYERRAVKLTFESFCYWPVSVRHSKSHPTARIPTNPGIAPRIASKNNRNRAG